VCVAVSDKKLMRAAWARTLLCALLSTLASGSLRSETVFVFVTAGAWPEEVTWELRCDDGASLAGGAPFDSYMYSTIGATCVLSMYDSWGDGWNDAEFHAVGMSGLPSDTGSTYGPYTLEDGPFADEAFTLCVSCTVVGNADGANYNECLNNCNACMDQYEYDATSYPCTVDAPWNVYPQLADDHFDCGVACTGCPPIDDEWICTDEECLTSCEACKGQYDYEAVSYPCTAGAAWNVHPQPQGAEHFDCTLACTGESDWTYDGGPSIPPAPPPSVPPSLLPPSPPPPPPSPPPGKPSPPAPPAPPPAPAVPPSPPSPPSPPTRPVSLATLLAAARLVQHRRRDPPALPPPSPPPPSPPLCGQCDDPCGSTDCLSAARSFTCSELTSIGCNCDACCSNFAPPPPMPPALPPPPECNKPCGMMDCLTARDSGFTCESLAEVGCDCHGCCEGGTPG